VDRQADVWESLITIADAAGGDWPERACVSRASFVSSAQQKAATGMEVRLLADLRSILGSEKKMFTETISTFEGRQ